MGRQRRAGGGGGTGVPSPPGAAPGPVAASQGRGQTQAPDTRPHFAASPTTHVVRGPLPRRPATPHPRGHCRRWSPVT